MKSSKTETIDMEILREFFDPHPGFAGAAIPIPEIIRKIANELDGKKLSLSEAIARLRSAKIGTIEIVSKHNYISLYLDGGNRYNSHLFRVIRYR